MITLRLPGTHPNQPVIAKWAQDKESIIGNHTTQLKQIQGILKTILTNNPDLGKTQ
jgi:hypothetical protein